MKSVHCSAENEIEFLALYSLIHAFFIDLYAKEIGSRLVASRYQTTESFAIAIVSEA